MIRYTPLRPFVIHLNHTGASLGAAVNRPPAGAVGEGDAVVGGSTT
nr:phosphoglycerate mutase [Mycolicibacter nonchromogenicus]